MMHVMDFDLTHNQCGYISSHQDHGDMMIENISLNHTPKSFNNDCKRIAHVAFAWTGGFHNLVPT
eukprot:scaffold454877_cov39-Prasinocladus_malaysianus.AAC.1